MATSSKKSTNTSTASAMSVKKPVAKKVVADISASKATAKKAAVVPVKKSTAAATKNTAPTPAKKVSIPKTENSTSKPATIAKIASRKPPHKSTIAYDDRHHMIATAAYFRAEKRGFASGYEIEDWICGEAQIGAMLNA